LRVAASATAEPVFTSQAPQMWDSALPPAGMVVRNQNGDLVAKPSGMAAYSSQAGPGAGARLWQVPLSVSGSTISLAPPRAALTAPGNVYPLYIDPSFESDPVNEDNSAWTQVDKGYPAQTYWEESSDLQVGLCPAAISPPGQCGSGNGVEVARSFFRMPVPSQLTTKTSINSAYVYMTDQWASSCTKEAVDLRTTVAFGPNVINSATDWDNQPALSSTGLSQSVAFGYDSSCPYSTNDVTWNVTSTIASDAGHYYNQTWGLIANDESNDLAWKQFLSGSSKITMSISYHNPPNQPTALQNAPAGTCKSSYDTQSTIGADDVTLSATVGDVDNANGDDSLSTTFTVKSYSSGDPMDTITVKSGDAAGGLTVSTTIPHATIETWAKGSASYHWYASTTDAGSPVLTSPQSQTCYFLYNPAAPARPGVTVSSSTATIGTSFSATFTPPSGCGTASSPCPVSYTYQMGVGRPVTVPVNDSPASGDWTGNITMGQVGPVQLSVYGTAAGGNPGAINSGVEVTGNSPSSPYQDGYFTGGRYPSVLTTGPGTDPSLWLSVGTGNGSLAPAADIGSLGTELNPGADGPADWAGAEVLHGNFTGTGVEDVMAYYPSGNSSAYAGDGVIIGGQGDVSPLNPYSGNVWTLSDPVADPFEAAQDNPTVLVAAGDASEDVPGVDDLIGIVGDSANGYELDLFSVSGAGTCTGSSTIGGYGFCEQLSTTAPDGTADWNNYALATAQPGGKSSAVVLFALDKATGALYESVNPACNTQVITGCGQGSTASTSLVGMAGTWTTISTPWGTTAPDLVSADVDNAGSVELWTVSGGTAIPYTLRGTALSQENSGSPLGYASDDWQLNDGNTNAQGSNATAATDSVTGDTSTITGTCTGSCFWADDDFFGTVANMANTNDSEASYLAVNPPGIIPSTATSASISLWFNTTATDGVLVSYDGSRPTAATISSGYDPVLYVGTDGKLQADWFPVAQLSSTAPVDDGLWHHVVLTDNGSSETLILDGVIQGTASGGASFTWATPGYLDFGAGYLGGIWADEPHYTQSGNTGYLTDFSGEMAGVTLNPPAATAQLCSQNQTTPVDGGLYDVQNNYWSGGTTCVQTDGGPDFAVSAASMSSSSVGAFPEIWSGCHWGACTADDGQAGRLPIQVSDLGDTTSGWTTTLPATGTYDAAYDMWFNTTPATAGQPNGGEVMVWLGENGMTDHSSTVTYIDGVAWYVAQTTLSGYGVTWPLVTYQRVTPATSVTNLDLRGFIRDAAVRGVVSPSSYLTSVEAGYDIEQASGSPGLTTSSFVLNPVTGIPSGPIGTALSATKCVDDLNSGTAAGTAVDINDCNGTAAQNWAVVIDGTIQVTINGTTMCMGLANNATSAGTGVTLQTCDGSATEIWEPGETGGLWNEASNMCLADPQSSTTDGTQLVIAACDGGSEQNWALPRD
jgi:hypothetical protein